MSTRTDCEDATDVGHALAAGRHGPLVRLGGFLREAIVDFLAYRMRKTTEAHLMGLDDRMLKDIGIDRSEISSAVRHGDRFPGSRWQRQFPFY